MKKQFLTSLALLFLISACSWGCGKEEAEPVTIPETIVEETVSEEDFVSGRAEEPPGTLRALRDREYL